MNLDKLKGHIPDNVITQIPDVMKTFGIDTPVELAHNSFYYLKIQCRRANTREGI